ncbi:MAG TPA: N-acetylmuramoyl-L-alanine amidase [Candidatus Dormibacteraeota bacterium]|nr:N-acetylmuramoyl-L-alanine amidase [Candidatus Dormibacteraeota bacterium]
MSCCLVVIGIMALMRPAGAAAGVVSLALAPRTPAPSQLPVAGIDAGACISYPAAGAQTGKTVFIDAGHGGLDPGVVGSAGGKQVLEKDATLAVATRLGALLRADGYGVVMARTQDSSVTKLAASDSITGALTNSAEHRDLVTRVACANAADASVLVSIHFDGFSDPTVGGTETFYDAARPFAATSKRLAADLQAGLVAGLGTSDRGVWTDDQLAAPALTSSGDSYGHLIELGPASAGWVDDPSQMPGALVEPLFITNPAEAQIASDPAGQQRIAQAMEAALVKFFSGA